MIKKQINILGINIDVISNGEYHNKNNMGLWVEIDQKIYINSNMPEDNKKATLVHEVIHAISDILHLNLDEAQVTALSAGLYCVIKDNPGLMEYLRSGKKYCQKENVYKKSDKRKSISKV